MINYNGNNLVTLIITREHFTQKKFDAYFLLLLTNNSLV